MRWWKTPNNHEMLQIGDDELLLDTFNKIFLHSCASLVPAPSTLLPVRLAPLESFAVNLRHNLAGFFSLPAHTQKTNSRLGRNTSTVCRSAARSIASLWASLFNHVAFLCSTRKQRILTFCLGNLQELYVTPNELRLDKKEMKNRLSSNLLHGDYR